MGLAITSGDTPWSGEGATCGCVVSHMPINCPSLHTFLGCYVCFSAFCRWQCFTTINSWYLSVALWSSSNTLDVYFETVECGIVPLLGCAQSRKDLLTLDICYRYMASLEEVIICLLCFSLAVHHALSSWLTLFSLFSWAIGVHKLHRKITS